MSERTANRLAIPQQAQRQDALADQLRDLHHLAARAGMYDAADWLWKRLEGNTENVRERPTEPNRTSERCPWCGSETRNAFGGRCAGMHPHAWHRTRDTEGE